MTKNILDTILNNEEPIKKTIIPKEKTEQENKKIKGFLYDQELTILDHKKNTEPQKQFVDNFDFKKNIEQKIKNKKQSNHEQSPNINNTSREYKKHKPTKNIRTATIKKISKKKKLEEEKNIEISTAPQPLWLSISEAAKISGVEQKTIRRAIQSNRIKFKIINDRYLVEFASMVKYLYSNTKLRNKFLNYGIGQYIEKWI